MMDFKRLLAQILAAAIVSLNLTAVINAEQLQENVLKGASATESLTDGGGTAPAETALTDENIQGWSGSANCWFVNVMANCSATPYVILDAGAEICINKIVIYSGSKELISSGNTYNGMVQHILRPDTLGRDVAFYFSDDEETWTQASVIYSSATGSYEAPQEAIFRFNEMSGRYLKIEITQGAGNNYNSGAQGFRIREIMGYYSDEEIPEQTPAPSTEPTATPSIYDYDVTTNVLFGLDEDAIYVSGGEITKVTALIDGKRESASGAGDTKWFVEKPTGEDSVAFNLGKNTVISQAVIYTGYNNSTAPDILDSYKVQYYDGAKYVDIPGAKVTGNTAHLAQVSFSPVKSDSFKVVCTTGNRFRIQEIQLTKPEISVDIKLEVEGTNLLITVKVGTDEYVPLILLDGQELTAEGESGEYTAAENNVDFGMHNICATVYDSDGRLINSSETEVFIIDADAILEAINGKSDYDMFAQQLERQEKALKYLGFNVEAYKKISENARRLIYDKLCEADGYTADNAGIMHMIADIEEYTPLCALNGAQTSTDVIYCFDTYSEKYNVETEDYAGLTLEYKEQFGAGMASYMEKNGMFNGCDEIETAYMSCMALVMYNAAYALSLPSVFEKYSSVCEVQTDYIKSSLLNSTLLKLKTKNITDYGDIPAMLKQAYNEVNAGTPSGGSGSGSSGGSGGSVAVSPAVTGKVYTEFVPTETAPQTFNDLELCEWARDAIEYLAKKQIASGMGDGNFYPDNPVTRAEFVKLIVCAFGFYDETAGCSFEDTDLSQWHYRYIASAAKKGIIKGLDEHIFGCNDNITREDMAVIAMRAAIVAGKKLTQGEEAFKDSDEISDYAEEAVGVLSCSGIISGLGNGIFAPKYFTTRAETAVLIYRLIGMEGGNVYDN